MSLDTYENLKQEIIDWSHRDDVDLRIDTFIQLAESEMFANQIEPLRVRSEETLASLTMDSVTPSRYLALPAGFQSMRKLRVQIVNGGSFELEYRTPSQMRVLSSVGLPSFFTITSQIEFDREPDQDYAVEMQYIKDFTPLSTAAPTNDILTSYPTIYLFGALWALYNWADNIEDAARYQGQFIQAIRGANKKAEMGRYGPSPVMIVDGCKP